MESPEKSLVEICQRGIGAEMENRDKTLLEVIRQGLQIYGQDFAKASLGDRTEYIGISDLARYQQCPRAALAAKLYPPESSLDKLITFQRGHWFERGLGECLTHIGMKALHQLEVAIQHENVPIHAHLDFTLVWEKPYPAVRILEIKSMSNLPDKPYPEHILQAEYQVNLVQEYWNEPVFSTAPSNGKDRKMNFPELCKKRNGINLSDSVEDVSIESWLVCMSMKDAKCFGPFQYSSEVCPLLLKTGEMFWNQYRNLLNDSLELNDLPHVKGHHLLCGFCQANTDCPKFSTDQCQPEWEKFLGSWIN